MQCLSQHSSYLLSKITGLHRKSECAGLRLVFVPLLDFKLLKFSRFFMDGAFLTPLAVFLNLKFSFHIDLITRGYVILTFALRADKRDYLS